MAWRMSRDILATGGTNVRTVSLRKDGVENPSNAIETVDCNRRIHHKFRVGYGQTNRCGVAVVGVEGGEGGGSVRARTLHR